MGLNRIASRNNLGTVCLALTLSLFAAGCKKKVPAPTPPPPAPPPKVEVVKPAAAPLVATFEAEPSTVERGQAATLRWTVTGQAPEVRIEPGVGTVNASGSRQVFPGNTTTYTLTATNPGGSNSATATVTVTTPTPKPTPPPAKVKRSASDWLASRFTMRCSITTAARFGRMPARSFRGMPKHSRHCSLSTPRQSSVSKVTRMSAARLSTTWAWQIVERQRRRSSWCNWEFPKAV